MSARRTTLWREKEAVGPWGRWLIVIAVGVPRCSCRRITSDSAEAFALDNRFSRIRLPRFNRIDVGSRSRISLLKVERRVEGSLEVVTSGRGSVRPDRREYSSSKSCASVSRDSSNLKSFRSSLSFAIEGSSGFPLANEAFKAARFSAIDASRSCRARR